MILTHEQGEWLPKPTGVRMLEAGLSYLLPGIESPPAYLQAWQDSRVGVHDPSLYGLAEKESLHPMRLKDIFLEMGPSFKVTEQWAHEEALVSCEVSNVSTHLNEANLLILKSHIDNAGLGLFLKPTSNPTRGMPRTIPAKARVCLYARNFLDPRDVDSLPTSDYLLETEVHGRRCYFDAHFYTGAETGRFANQGGLQQGLEALCLACDSASGNQSYSRQSVNQVIAGECQLKFATERGSLYLEASRTITSCDYDATELFVNYDIEYWLRYVVDRLSANAWQDGTLPTDMVQRVLWTLLSRHSVFPADNRLLREIPGHVSQLYVDMACPVIMPQARRR